MFGASAVFGILPFAGYRFATGDLITGVVDLTLALSIAGAAVYAWYSGETRLPGLFLAVVNTTGATVIAFLVGEAGLFWMYAVLLANFFLVDRRKAVLATALALIALVVHGKSFDSLLEMILFLVTSSVVSLFAFILAYRSEVLRIQLETLATHDALTGVHNRRALEEELQIAVAIYKRSRCPFGLVILDLDHFKPVNDRYGHDAGDRVLIACAELIQKATRKVDRVFRFGGDEFVVLLRDAGVAGLRTFSDNLRSRIASELSGPSGGMTISVGAALLENEHWQSWLGRADAAMYRAKRGGRNRIVIDGVEDSPV